MKIDKETMLFKDLTIDDVKRMQLWVEDVVLNGRLEWPTPDWLETWYSELGFNSDDHRLLTQSTVVPQRVLLSIVKFYEKPRFTFKDV